MRKVFFSILAFGILVHNPTFGKDAFLNSIQNSLPKKVPFEIGMWFEQVQDGNFEEAAHLWTEVEAAAPDSLRPKVESTFLYLLWKQKLPRTFLLELSRVGDRAALLKSKEFKALFAEIEPEFTAWMQKTLPLDGTNHGPLLSAAFPYRSISKELVAWTNLRENLRAAQSIRELPANHPLLPYLTRAAIVRSTHENRTDEVLDFLNAKSMQQPAVQPWKNLILGRIYYKKGRVGEAEKYYRKIPRGSEEFLAAQEEILWILLRKNDVGTLRGHLGTLASLYSAPWRSHEFRVVRAISDLKLCYFDQVEQDLEQFAQINGEWAQKIEASLASAEVPRPPRVDWYTDFAEKASEEAERERVEIQALYDRSVAASLPSVGKQKHWKKISEQIRAEADRMKRLVAKEYRREWQNERLLLNEAAQKMQFVKVELLSQMNQKVSQKPDSPTTRANQEKTKAEIEKSASGKMAFPFDGVDWADERFSLKSDAVQQCL